MAYRVIVKCGGGAFFVPYEAVQNLKLCTAAQLRVLLLALSRGANEITPETVSEELGMSLDDAKDLLDYWVERNILENGNSSETKPAEVSTASRSLLVPPETKPTMKEVERITKEQPDVAFVLKEAERILGKTFTSSDTMTLVWLISWAGIAPEVLVTVIEYCNSMGKTNMRYINSVALEWLDAGIDTVEKAEERMRALNEANSWEGEVKSVLEIYGRKLVTKEKEFCSAWRMLGISTELIRAAYERTIELTGKLSFPYINKILVSWKQKGISTPEEAAAEAKEKAEKGASEKASFNMSEIELRMMNEDPVI